VDDGVKTRVTGLLGCENCEIIKYGRWLVSISRCRCSIVHHDKDKSYVVLTHEPYVLLNIVACEDVRVR